METINAIGRRKASVARVYLTKGGGNITINGKDLSNYFPMQNIQNSVTEPLKVSELEKQYDIKINVSGGGFKGQAEDGIRDFCLSRGLGDVYKRQLYFSCVSSKEFLRFESWFIFFIDFHKCS